MKKMMVLLAATLALSAGGFAQTSQPKKMDSTHRTMKKPMKKPMKKRMDSTSMSTDSSANPMR